MVFIFELVVLWCFIGPVFTGADDDGIWVLIAVDVPVACVGVHVEDVCAEVLFDVAEVHCFVGLVDDVVSFGEEAVDDAFAVAVTVVGFCRVEEGCGVFVYCKRLIGDDIIGMVSVWICGWYGVEAEDVGSIDEFDGEGGVNEAGEFDLRMRLIPVLEWVEVGGV